MFVVITSVDASCKVGVLDSNPRCKAGVVLGGGNTIGAAGIRQPGSCVSVYICICMCMCKHTYIKTYIHADKHTLYTILYIFICTYRL